MSNLRKEKKTDYCHIVWSMEKANHIPSTYSGENGHGELQRRVGFGEYLDKHAMAIGKEAASTNSPTPDKLSVVNLTLMGFVVDSDPFFLWFNPHRLRKIDFKDHCVDAGFALPVYMSEHVVVSWPRQDTTGEAMWARRVRPGEIKLIDLGSKKDKGAGNKGGGSKGKERGNVGAASPGAAKAGDQAESPAANAPQGQTTARRIGGLLNIGGRRFIRKRK